MIYKVIKQEDFYSLILYHFTQSEKYFWIKNVKLPVSSSFHSEMFQNVKTLLQKLKIIIFK